MTGFFHFKQFKDRILMTNESGRYMFLKPDDFQHFIQEPAVLTDDLKEKLKSNLFWTDESQETFIRQGAFMLRDAENYLFEGTSLFIFAITNECNNRCVYCQAHGTAIPKRMSFETADQALLRIQECPNNNITIEFQGGEPLTHFPLIRHVIESSRTILSGKNVSFTIVSNLSLLTDEIAAFIKDNNITISTSLDGPQYLHDFNRPQHNKKGSYDGLLSGLELLSRYGITAGAIQTTTAQSLQYPVEIVNAYVHLGLRHIFLRPLTRLGEAARSWKNIGYTADEYLSFYRRALDEIIRQNTLGNKLVEYQATIFLSKILNGKAVNYMELRSPCGASIGQMAITASGNVYTCDEGRMMAEMGDEAFLLGNVYTSGYEEWLQTPCCKAVSAASLLETQPDCCDCVFKPYCGICPVINYALNGDITKISREKCKIYAGILDILFEYLLDENPETLSMFSEWSEQT